MCQWKVWHMLLGSTAVDSGQRGLRWIRPVVRQERVRGGCGGSEEGGGSVVVEIVRQGGMSHVRG